MEAPVTKQAVRRQLRHVLAQVDTPTRTDASAAIVASLTALPAVRHAVCLGLFAPTPDEVDIRALFTWAVAAGKRVAFPRILDLSTQTMDFAEVSTLTALVPGPFGVLAPEPQAPRCDKLDIHCLCIPGVGFDLNGMRLGRGSGYYDRWLGGYLGPRVAVAFEVQLMADLPASSWDEPMDILVTERRTIVCRAGLNTQRQRLEAKEES
ncbi:MAG: 5-formyltetrahydrofolate cyclo-ligase [Deltaproteobacteria bacterium]|nr:5-formyltetrahydrofolate cyclo-ligase [Deltaproteobacteria bacterium]